MTQEHSAKSYTSMRFDQVVSLIGDLTWIELQDLRDYILSPEIDIPIYECAVERRIEEAKRFWANLTTGDNWRGTHEALRKAWLYSLETERELHKLMEDLTVKTG